MQSGWSRQQVKKQGLVFSSASHTTHVKNSLKFVDSFERGREKISFEVPICVLVPWKHANIHFKYKVWTNNSDQTNLPALDVLLKDDRYGVSNILPQGTQFSDYRICFDVKCYKLGIHTPNSTQQPFNIVWLVCCGGAVQWNLFNYYLLPPIHHPIDTWAKHVVYSTRNAFYTLFPPKQLLHLLKSHKYLICRYDLNKSASYCDTYTMFGCHQIQFTAYLTKSRFKTTRQQKS